MSRRVVNPGSWAGTEAPRTPSLHRISFGQRMDESRSALVFGRHCLSNAFEIGQELISGLFRKALRTEPALDVDSLVLGHGAVTAVDEHGVAVGCVVRDHAGV